MKTIPQSLLLLLLLLFATNSYAVDPITGTLSVCTGSTTTLSNATAGGTWSSGDISIATVGSSSGIVSGVVAGTAIVTYTFPTLDFTTEVVTVNPLPDAGTISGPTSVCIGFGITLSNSVSGGTWSSSDIAVATISTGGLVAGLTSGTTTVFYSVTNGCGTVADTMEVTVNPLPDPIAGTLTVCNTTTTTLTNAATGGTWSSTSIRVTVGSATGIVTGMAVGTAGITYRLPTGCFVTAVATVNQQPATITGALSVCVGATKTLTNSTLGGTWSSSNAGVANFGTATVGTISGISVDTARITYTLANGCFRSGLFTVNPVPGPITGTFALCAGTTTTLANSLPGGTWGSSVTAKAVVNTTSGFVQAYTAGTTTISYTTTGNCKSSVVVTVLAAPAAITGTLNICDGATTQLNNTVPLGSWESADTSIALLVTPTGLVGGNSAGTTTISYTLANGCYKAVTLTVNALPADITGPGQVCTARTVSLTSGPSGGTWSSSNSAKATVGTAGNVTGVTAGSVIITYRLPTGCRKTFEMSVSPTPAAIAGTLTVCEGLTTSLTSATPGGSWISSNTSVATIAGVAGITTGVASGTSTISFVMIATGCNATATLTVNASPSTITGPSIVCASGDTMILTSAATGGTWSSSNTSIATAGSATGIVSGVTAGTAIITYRIPTGCVATHPITVNALPYAGVITGAPTVCETGTTTLAASVAGGTWSSLSGLVSVSAGGVVTGLGGGVDVVLYTITDGCGDGVAEYPITVNPLPDTAVITGSNQVCLGLTATLVSSLLGGTWSNSSTTVATVSSTGVLTGIALGTSLISYTRTNACGVSVATIPVTVRAIVNPGVITGKDTTCMNDIIHLADTVSGGVWVSTAPWIASVDEAGTVTGIFPGTATIMYIATNICSKDTALHPLVVKMPGECVTSVRQSVVAEVNSISVYPNPTNGVFTFETPVKGSLTIYTLDGREVKSFEINAMKETIVMPRNMATGIYMCRFMGSDGRVVITKIVYEP